jgi:hypothetical protein
MSVAFMVTSVVLKIWYHRCTEQLSTLRTLENPEMQALALLPKCVLHSFFRLSFLSYFIRLQLPSESLSVPSPRSPLLRPSTLSPLLSYSKLQLRDPLQG